MSEGLPVELQGAREGRPAADDRTFEDALERIGGVTSARVVRAAGGRIAEVHIVATPERSPKQIVRDVQSVGLAKFGVDVDYRTVSVVQLAQERAPRLVRPQAAAAEVAVEPPPAVPQVAAEAPVAAPVAVTVTSVATETARNVTRASVRVEAGGTSRPGSARGPASLGLALVARAVVDALAGDGGLLGDDVAEVEGARVEVVGEQRLAVVVVHLASESGETRRSASENVDGDPALAVALATVAALSPLRPHSA
jgi:hypothetical protein